MKLFNMFEVKRLAEETPAVPVNADKIEGGEVSYALKKWDSDDLNQDKVASKQGIEEYFKMDNDPQIRLCKSTFNNTMLSSGWKIQPTPDTFKSDGTPAKDVSDKQKEAIEFLYWNFTFGLDGRLEDAIERINEAKYIGFSLNEKIFDICENNPKWKGKWYLSRLKDIDQRMIFFERDVKGNLINIRQDYTSQQGGTPLLPLSKFILYTYPYVKRQNYYGEGDYSAAYTYWLTKKTMMQWVAAYGEKEAKNKIAVLVTKSNSTENDKAILQIRKALAGAITTLAKDNVTSKDDIIQFQGNNASAFFEWLYRYLDKQMSKAILIPGLIVEEEGTGAYSTIDKRSDQFAVGVHRQSIANENIVNENIVNFLCTINFGLTYCPQLMINPPSLEKPLEKSQRMQIDIASGIVDASESWVREDLGYPAKVEEDTEPDDTTQEETGQGGANEADKGKDTKTGAKQGKGSAQEINTTVEQVLNGAQITAAVDIIKSVTNGDIPRDAGINMLVNFFNIKPEVAERIMGAAGTKQPTQANPVIGLPETEAKSKQPISPEKLAERNAHIDHLLKLAEKYPHVPFLKMEEQWDTYEDYFIDRQSGVVKDYRDKLIQRVKESAEKYGFTDAMFAKDGTLKIRDISLYDYQQTLNDLYVNAYLVGKAEAYNETVRAVGELKFAEAVNITIPVKPLPFQEAIAYFKKKIPISKDALKAYDKRAFTMAGQFEGDALKKAQNIILNGIKSGNLNDTTYKIKNVFDEYLTETDTGRVVGTTFHANVVVRTNYAEAFNEGRMELYNEPEINESIEAYQAAAILDDRTTEYCAGHDGQYLDKNDPRLGTRAKFPAHYFCRTIWIAVYTGEPWEKNWDDTIPAPPGNFLTLSEKDGK